MREWSPPARIVGSGENHHVCMAAFFMIMGAAVFVVALLCALGFISLLA